MNEYLIGIGLMVAGAVLFFFDHAQSKRRSVHASGGSVAVGGNNSGTITNTNVNQASKVHGAGGHGIVTVLAIVVELLGIAVTIWHAMHLDAK
jgi:uncharacterized membrane protein